MIQCFKCEQLHHDEKSAILHAQNNHSLTRAEWKLAHDHNGIIPLCKCNCGTPVKFCHSYGHYSTYIRGHHMREPHERKKMSKSIKKALENPEMTKRISQGVRKHLENHPEKGNKPAKYTFKVQDLITQQDCYLHSSWELLMWVYARELNLPLSRNHGIMIPYTQMNKEHYYVPDYTLGRSLIEIKGWIDSSVEHKEDAAKMWCERNDMEYIMLFSEK